jgi:hypothetical protein
LLIDNGNDDNGGGGGGGGVEHAYLDYDDVKNR